MVDGAKRLVCLPDQPVQLLGHQVHKCTDAPGEGELPKCVKRVRALKDFWCTHCQQLMLVLLETDPSGCVPAGLLALLHLPFPPSSLLPPRASPGFCIALHPPRSNSCTAHDLMRAICNRYIDLRKLMEAGEKRGKPMWLSQQKMGIIIPRIATHTHAHTLLIV